MKVVVAYVPVLHEGYRQFFEKHQDAKKLYIFGPELTAEFPQLKKEIRELDPELMRAAVESLGLFEEVTVLDKALARSLDTGEYEVVLPEEDVSRELAEKYFPNANASFDSVFLRWDKHNAQKETFHTRILSRAHFGAARENRTLDTCSTSRSFTTKL